MTLSHLMSPVFRIGFFYGRTDITYGHRVLTHVQAAEEAADNQRSSAASSQTAASAAEKELSDIKLKLQVHQL